MSGLKIAIAGAGGRMGQAIARTLDTYAGDAAPYIHSAFDRTGSSSIRKSVGSLIGSDSLVTKVTDDIGAALNGADAIIDFTAPAATVDLARRAAEKGLVHIIGTTGCSEEDEAAIVEAAANGARIVKSGNFSMGVVLLASLVKKAAAALPGYDIEVLEMHHNRKVDAPSGTALLLGNAAAAGREISLKDKAVYAREGHTGAREAGTIGFATLRGGTVVGDHTVMLAGPSERIELTHRAEDRAIFANGAVRAAIWAADKPAGLYSMADVLGLND